MKLPKPPTQAPPPLSGEGREVWVQGVERAFSQPGRGRDWGPWIWEKEGAATPSGHIPPTSLIS